MSLDEYYMRLALKEAEKGLGRTSPNPTVGAVIVRDEQVVGKGYHHKAGLPHAEINALQTAGPRAAGATMFVTLEPCCHLGKTGPCTDALIQSGISRVVIGQRDPAPPLRGRINP